jgi:hypothetical protein
LIWFKYFIEGMINRKNKKKLKKFLSAGWIYRNFAKISKSFWESGKPLPSCESIIVKGFFLDVIHWIQKFLSRNAEIERKSEDIPALQCALCENQIEVFPGNSANFWLHESV